MDRTLAERLSTLMVDAALDEIEVSRVLIRENLIERMRRELLCFDDRVATFADVVKSAKFGRSADGDVAIASTVVAGDPLGPRKTLADITAKAIRRLDENCIDLPDIDKPTNRPWEDYWRLWPRKREMLSISRYLLPPGDSTVE